MARKKKKKYQEKQPAGRIPTAPGTRWHEDKSKYKRKPKHQESYNEN